MLKPTESACPKCRSPRHRASRWRTHDEKHGNPGKSPVRCVECGHRFLVAAQPAERGRGGGQALGAGIAIGMVVFVLVGLFVVQGTEEAEELLSGGAPVPAKPSFVAPETLVAAEAGDPQAQLKVGRSLMYDSADNAGAPDALDWLQRAADAGNVEAMVHLGKAYRTGIGALQNFTLAADWISRAAEANDPQGMLELGRLYRDGIGVEQDLILAYVWLNRSAAKLNREAAHERDRVMGRLGADDLKAAQQLSLELEAGKPRAALP